MQGEELVHQLKAVLPKYLDGVFNDTYNIVSATKAGNIVTIQTDQVSHLQVGNGVLITDVKFENSIVSLKRHDNIAVALTTNPHDFLPSDKEIEISGASDSKYNGIKKIYNQNLLFEITSFAVNQATNQITITTTEANPFIVNSNYKISLYDSLGNSLDIDKSIASITNTNTFIINNSRGITNDWDIKYIYLKPSPYLIFFEVDQTATTPATGSPIVKKLINGGFNGYKLVTSVHSHQFTFINNDNIGTIGYGGKVKSAPRIFGASSLTDARNLYQNFATTEDNGVITYKPSLAVVIGERLIGKDPNNNTDVSNQALNYQTLRIMQIVPISLYIFYPLTYENNNYTNAYVKDKCLNYFKPILKSIGGFAPSSQLSEASHTRITPINDGVAIEEDGLFCYNYNFETTIYLRNNPSADDFLNEVDRVALKEFNLIQNELLNVSGKLN
jgi:hypothetical protein